MIKYQSDYEGEGIQILKKRFICGLSKEDRVFREGRMYRKQLELSILLSLGVFVLLFQGWKLQDRVWKPVQKPNLVLTVEEIPRTEQPQQAPAPSRPSVPIVAEDEEIPEDETIAYTFLDLEEAPPPPPPPMEDDGSTPLFVAYDEPPVPIGGMAEIQNHLIYPEIGRRSGVEGKVVLNVLIDEKGNVRNFRVIQSLGIEEFTEAAIRAIRSVKWKPAKQRDVPITVWCCVPIEFVLVNEI